MIKLDFTLTLLKELYQSLLNHNYKIISFSDFLQIKDAHKVCILRHDVDRGLDNALLIAEKEESLGIKAAYFFRYPKTFNKDIIEKIHALGHEVGYHYETLSKANGDHQKAIELFEKELEEFRKIVPVKTISSHGSPLSRWDNRRLWERYDAGDFGIIGDASLSMNFNEILYLTDTGRGWDKEMGNIRDSVATVFNYKFGNTYKIVKAVRKGGLPDKIMLNIHPNRWNENLFGWGKELVGQGIKNLAKRALIHR